MSPRIGLDARMITRVPNGLGNYARSLAEAVTRLDPGTSYIVIRRPDSGPPIAARSNVEEIELAGDLSAPTFGGAISALGLDLYHSLHHFVPIGLRVPRVVVTLHDLIWIEHPSLIQGGALGRIARQVTHLYGRVAIPRALRRADRIIAISAYSAARAIARYGLDRGRIEVVHHGVAHDRFFPTVPSQPSRGEPYFLCLGNTRPYKNISTALQAFAECCRRRPGIRLVIAGRGDSLNELRLLARALRVNDRVSFTGLVSDAELLRLLHGAVALVFPSIIEGFGLPVLEAMAAGCPVVASNCPTLVEIAGGAALHCDPASPSDFSTAMQGLLHDPALRADLRNRGIAHAAGFAWETCAARTLGVYRSLLLVQNRQRVALG
jgi:glycosyltransferase involved in cell wall biosynthesis